jgi:hypothetical protein
VGRDEAVARWDYELLDVKAAAARILQCKTPAVAGPLSRVPARPAFAYGFGATA